MKRTIIGASFALACTAAVTPLAASPQAHAAGAAAGTTGLRTIAMQTPAQMASLTSTAQAEAGDISDALGLTKEDTFKVTNLVKDTNGFTHTHVDRYFKGILVRGGDLVVHRDASGKIIGHDGMFAGKVTVDLKPTLTAAQATRKGLVAAEKEADHDGLKNATEAGTNLVLFIDEDGKQHLGYETLTNGFADDNTPARIHSVIDADTGATLQAYDDIAHADGTGKGIYIGTVPMKITQSGGGYQLKNPDNGNYATDSGNRKTDGTVFTSSSTTFGNGSNSDRASAGADAEFGADKTFEFYKNVMGRNGIWDDGRGTRSRVHYDHNYANAFWDGKQMTYGDGDNDAKPLTELDVSGHEMTHGVTQNSARLVYSGDAGGLNESTSDILGSGVEWYANLSTDKPDYYMGETIDLRGNGQPLRWFDQPSKDHRSPDCWSSSVASMDPHNSSGPLNHWYYLASEGSGKKTINGENYDSPTCNNSEVKGAGHDKIEKIWYRTLTTKLTATSNYKKAREGAIQSAIEMFGASSQECFSVQTAFDAISVPAGSAKCSGQPTPAPTPTPTPTSTPEPTPAPTPTPTPTSPSGGVNDDTFTVGKGKSAETFNALENDSVPAGTRVRWTGLPGGPSLYVRGNSDGTLSIYRAPYIHGTFECSYSVEPSDGTRQTAKVTLVLN